ncbi:hypothetical protein ANCDUO_03887 [Ancylostoma duodenale]|uniref:Uncharacterized protein n=1 Tax=Ancylostoma duodenale TaxID=51022 RepID=A0A0C2GW82_9BILA|nr:hypothetical protein ANCDUO_03887 [Ancylostoma duodenale]
MAFSSEQMWNELDEFLYNSFLPNIAFKSGSALRFVVASSRFVLSASLFVVQPSVRLFGVSSTGFLAGSFHR